MGEIAEMMINGYLCEGCGVFLDGEEPGFPRRCEDCKEASETNLLKQKKRRNTSKKQKSKKKQAKKPQPKFPLGKVVYTRGINAILREQLGFNDFIQKSVHRHHTGDWSDCCKDDKVANDFALKHGARIFTVYYLSKKLKALVQIEKIWIITEADRSSTCVLLPSEY